MDPGALGLADARLDHVDEGGHVVVGDPLALGDRGHQAGVDHRGPPPDLPGVGLGDHAHLGQPLDGQELDLEPAGQAGLVAEEGGHVGRAVAGDHRPAPPGTRPAETVAARSAMSVR